MNLYKIMRKRPPNWDEFEGMVVAAANEKQCIEKSNAEAYPSDGGWKDAEKTIEIIGRTISGTQPSVILSSYKAG